MALKLVLRERSSDDPYIRIRRRLKRTMSTRKKIMKKLRNLIYSPVIEDKTDEASNGGVEVAK